MTVSPSVPGNPGLQNAMGINKKLSNSRADYGKRGADVSSAHVGATEMANGVGRADETSAPLSIRLRA